MSQWPLICTQWWKIHQAQAGEEMQDMGLIVYGDILNSPLDTLLDLIMREIPMPPALMAGGGDGSPVEPDASTKRKIEALQESVEWHRLLVRLPLSISLPLISLAMPNRWDVKRRLQEDESQAISWLASNHTMLEMYFRKPPSASLPGMMF
ncbi:hypothetical protein [Acidithiobacillus ferrooxidans]|jgi:hypothetical protein|uniref:hypothetical protein n=1 Tax=Acidithiobacillus ferrooxidans TaxID=920 RepID=UPI0013D68D7D|nr:hypothetical protein [Acidithiobacillus ferrooxidans]